MSLWELWFWMQVLNCCWCLVTQLCSTLLQLQTIRLLCPWGFPIKNIGVGCHFLLQGIFLNQGSNSHLLRWLEDSLPLSHQGSHVLNKCYIWYVKSINFPCMIMLASAAKSSALLYIIICFVTKYRIQNSVWIPQVSQFSSVLVSKANHSISRWSKPMPQPVMLKKLKLNGSMKTYKTF